MSDLTFGTWDNEPAFQRGTKLEAAGKKFGSFSASLVGAIRGGSGGAKPGTKGIAHSGGWAGSTRQFANKVPHRVTLNRTYGLSCVARVMQVFGLVKNSTMVAGMSKHGMRKVVPDVRTSNAIYEIKSGNYI